MNKFLLLLVLSPACAMVKSSQIPPGQVRVECISKTTLESRVWQGPWSHLDLNFCDSDREYVKYDAQPVRYAGRSW